MTRKHLISWWLWQPQKCTIQFPLQDRAGRCKCGVSWWLPEVRTVRAFSFWAEAALVLGNPPPMTKHHGGSRAWMFLLTQISHRSSSLWSPHHVCILVEALPAWSCFLPTFLWQGSDLHHAVSASQRTQLTPWPYLAIHGGWREEENSLCRDWGGGYCWFPSTCFHSLPEIWLLFIHDFHGNLLINFLSFLELT